MYSFFSYAAAVLCPPIGILKMLNKASKEQPEMTVREYAQVVPTYAKKALWVSYIFAILLIIFAYKMLQNMFLQAVNVLTGRYALRSRQDELFIRNNETVIFKVHTNSTVIIELENFRITDANGLDISNFEIICSSPFVRPDIVTTGQEYFFYMHSMITQIFYQFLPEIKDIKAELVELNSNYPKVTG